MRNARLQPRDLDLFSGLLDSRLMSLTQVARLFFDGNLDTAKQRVQKLKAAGFVGERPRPPGSPSILFLTRSAFFALRDAHRLPAGRPLTWEFLENRPRVSNLTLLHELAVVGVKVAFCEALRKVPHLALAEFTTWPLFFQFKALTPARPGAPRRERLVKPDGFIRFTETTPEGVFELTFFLEVDRSSEIRDTLAEKAGCYMEFYRSGGYAERLGEARENFRDFPFRVLMVLANEERRNNIAERLLTCTPPILSQVWLTTSAEILADPLGAIWMRPIDYDHITQGTAFAPQRASQSPGYRRQSERENLIRSKLNKKHLLEAE